MLIEPGQDAECASRWVAVCATSKTALLWKGIPELCWDNMPASPRCWCINSSVDGDCFFESFLNGKCQAGFLSGKKQRQTHAGITLNHHIQLFSVAGKSVLPYNIESCGQVAPGGSPWKGHSSREVEWDQHG